MKKAQGQKQKKRQLPSREIANQIDTAARAAASGHMMKVERELHRIAQTIIGSGLPKARKVS